MRQLSRRLTLLERAVDSAIAEDPSLSTLSPHIDFHGKISFPTDEERQMADYREIDDDNVAGSLGDDLMATLNRRGVSNRAIQRHIVERLRDWLEARTCAESNGGTNG
jgi:hypothetical protein